MSLVTDVFTRHERPNIVVLTVDSCRFDTAALARTPNFDSLGPLRRAVTPGTFTLPSHMAFFSGYLPNVMELPHLDYYSREMRQLWRLGRAKRKARDSYHLHLEGDTLWEGFHNAGYHLLGAGGVRWFLTKTLTEGFDEFLFHGPDDYSNWFAERGPDDFVLDRPGELVRRLPSDSPWFLFVNALETHAPYNDGLNPPDPAVAEVIKRGAPIWAGRSAPMLDVDLTSTDYKVLHAAQVTALETVDARAGELFRQLSKPFIAVVCADHGESFGEDGRWGHGFASDVVSNVPMWVGAVT
ncbi:sulfatase-like hydrolase/transferase [Streptomyces sp. NPDC005548]|uniref:sulfatase-like hydrolase/transferase n=1 Tax=Streptomyces sp. NPDC005548 TaxID=3364724 RepID=UPI00368F914E